MHPTDNTIQETEALNDLLQINMDKITLYEKLKRYCAGCYLAEIIEELIQQSRSFVEVLRSCIPETAYNNPGVLSHTIYRLWNDLRALYSVNETLGLLAALEYNEDATIRAYEIVLSDLFQNDALCSLLKHQKELLLNNQKTIRLLQLPGKTPDQ
ncbi:hypothetical protein A8C56_13745 [Niabella ginsenosidivorans]|uniref:DUF2383 domain-containing protein n=1 Tax=Niabella ginsenosidivorans TaxID=1176587 RepID=A0A1A9I3K3_9BACT|nr:DUF2383 domain-containing protein [Niabella ginsenosidivorans]ANH81895.1 hypothetical protein A8C56_13745 [Niabella ginsenosidivorans]